MALIKIALVKVGMILNIIHLLKKKKLVLRTASLNCVSWHHRNPSKEDQKNISNSQDKMFSRRKVIQRERACWWFLTQIRNRVDRLTLQGWAQQLWARKASGPSPHTPQSKAGSQVTYLHGRIRTTSLGLYPSMQTAQLSKSGSVSCNRGSTGESAFLASTPVNMYITSQRRACLEQGFQLPQCQFS